MMACTLRFLCSSKCTTSRLRPVFNLTKTTNTTGSISLQADARPLHMTANVFCVNKDICRFSIPSKETARQDVRERLDQEEEKAGFLANVLAVFSRRPDEFNAFMNYYDLLMADRDGGSLTRAEKELIITATSAKNGCLYCTVAHGALHRLYSKNTFLADQVSANVEFAELTARERAIVEFAIRVSGMQPVTDEDIDSLSQHGLDREDVWDIGAVTAFFSMSNRYAHFTAMMPNKEFYAMGRIPKQKS